MLEERTQASKLEKYPTGSSNTDIVVAKMAEMERKLLESQVITHYNYNAHIYCVIYFSTDEIMRKLVEIQVKLFDENTDEREEAALQIEFIFYFMTVYW